VDSSYWAFLGVSMLAIMTPGPDTSLTIRNPFVAGRRGGVFTALGPVLARSRLRRTVDGVAGAVLIGLGVRVATEAR
jgi:threonine/homoserine/homoserine lactone efflux protein